MKKPTTKISGPRAGIEQLLVPGGASRLYLSFNQTETEESEGRWFAYSLLSSISSAIRERTEDQSRSTERTEISSASEVSAVVKPAK